MDPLVELRTHYLRVIDQQARSGYVTLEQCQEDAAESVWQSLVEFEIEGADDHELLEEVRLAAVEAFAQQKEREAGWTIRTQHDDLLAAFDDLTARGFDVQVGIRFGDGPLGFFTHAELPTTLRASLFLLGGLDGSAAPSMSIHLPREQEAQTLPPGGDWGVTSEFEGKERQRADALLASLAREVLFVCGHHGITLGWSDRAPAELGVPAFEWRRRSFTQPPQPER